MRSNVIDYLKAIAIVFVLLLHMHFISSSNPFYVLFIKMAVPIFIMLSGYTFTMVKYGGFQGWLRRFCRFTIPIVITYLAWILVTVLRVQIDGINFPTLKECITTFLGGKMGPGAYYYWIIMGFLIIFPIIKSLVYKFDVHGIIIVGVINLLWSLCCEYYQINENIHNILVIRYLLFIALGVYLYKIRENGSKISNEHLIQMMIVGVVYLFLPIYWGYEYKIFTYWSSTSMMTAFWVFPVIYILLHCTTGTVKENLIGKYFSLVGKASYHIMCVQIIYFNIWKKLFGLLGMSDWANWIKACLVIVIVVNLGICFYYVDNKVFGKLYKK